MTGRLALCSGTFFNSPEDLRPDPVCFCMGIRPPVSGGFFLLLPVCAPTGKAPDRRKERIPGEYRPHSAICYPAILLSRPSGWPERHPSGGCGATEPPRSPFCIAFTSPFCRPVCRHDQCLQIRFTLPWITCHALIAYMACIPCTGNRTFANRSRKVPVSVASTAPWYHWQLCKNGGLQGGVSGFAPPFVGQSAQDCIRNCIRRSASL